MALHSLFGSLRILPHLRSLAHKPINFNLLKVKPFQISSNGFQTTCMNNGLMEFFDENKNWGESEIQVGRSWKADELRIKSNSDLHKLWFILLKERNMLKTMEHECNEMIRLFPNPERIDKVEESMKNLETVVRERNKAYHILETGTSGERPAKVMSNAFGLKSRIKLKEHAIPRWAFGEVPKPGQSHYGGYAVKKFVSLFKEKITKESSRRKGRDRNHVKQLIKRFPNMDMEKLQAAYPEVDIAKARASSKSLGHYVRDD